MTAGIVCEYNPFHKGHLYQIEQTKKQGAENIICVMSGNFVQRGECAFLDKWTRAKIAVKCGADVVIDLPTPWAMASGETFARGSVGLLSAFGIDLLSFGSETDDKKALLCAAEAVDDEKTGVLIKQYLLKGLSYPFALSKAAGEVFSEKTEKILSSPNSTLAVEYIRQLTKQNKAVDFLPVKRVGTDHDSDKISESFISASALRKLISNGGDAEKFFPESAYEIITETLKNGFAPCLTENNERGILSALREMNKQDFEKYITDSNGLASRIYGALQNADNLQNLYTYTKSKNFTHSRVRREIMNCYLKIDKALSEGIPPYIKILAVNKKGLALLKKAKNNSPIPIITRHRDTDLLDEKGKAVYLAECKNADKFALFSKNVRECGLEQKNSMLIL
ncbi:MAG: nucleotidyltransferase family protein [Acutalibacteraceae bacterium]